jgi:prepilin-type N-terminal cleavage/methylation domain-containing protein
MSEKGLTLIELMIVMVISVIMAAGIYSAFTTMQFLDMNTQEYAHMHTNMRTAILLLDNDVENSGFLLFGALGGNECTTLLEYNSAVNSSTTTTTYPIQGQAQQTGQYIPGTSIPFNYTGPNGLATDYITSTAAGAFYANGPLGNGLFSVVKTTNGTLNNADLFLNSTAQITAGNIDIIMLPSTGVCIRLQVTNVGGANNVIHNSGLSNLNPPHGFNGVSATASPAIAPITLTEFQNAYVEDLGNPMPNMGPIITTFSIEDDSGVPTLYRTKVDGSGTVIENDPLVSNVIDMQVEYGVMTNGRIIYQDWTPTNATSIISVKLALLVKSVNPLKNYKSPSNIPLMNGISYTVPVNMQNYSYNVVKQTIALKNELEH